ncbi:MAG: LruC domain-containing protein [Bacteroidota bacterium]
MNKRLLPIFFSALILFNTACKKSTETTNPDKTEFVGDKAAPDGFKYLTTKEITINIRVLTESEKPLKGVMVSLYDPAKVTEGAELTKVLSDANGYARTKVKVNASLETFVVDAAYFGLLRNVKVYATNNVITAIIGGKSVKSGNIATSSTNYTIPANFKLSALQDVKNKISAKTVVDYDPKKFDGLGRPLAERLVTPDKIDWDELLANINKSLPESKDVDPKYIGTEAPANLKITALADVWITFVHEGADYRNSFAYYTYPTGNPPESVSDIDSLHMVFPNSSLEGHTGKGAMIRGDKVKIGRFKAGTSIGFMILQNAYNDDTSISTSNTAFYSHENLNPEDGKLQRHNVLLHDAKNKTFLIGFEDIDRRESGCDQDFNDLVVYAQSNPVEAIDPSDIPYIQDKVEDKDGDGVPDDTDEYPEDKDRAYNRYYPSEKVWGTAAFEDLWPSEGDYDLNDLVVSYHYKFAMSSSNLVVDFDAQYLPLAAGASQQNGFGVQLPISSDLVSSVTGYSLNSGYIKLGSNGVESGQPNAVLIPFDNFKDLFGGASSYVNTTSGSPKINGKAVTLSVQFKSPIAEDFTAAAPFNAFMISNLERGKEVHMVDKAPTALANLKLLGTQNDDSKPESGRYYVTNANRPFGIDFYGPFMYPAEKVSVADAYTHFAEWAKSGGQVYSDWFMDKDGYINKKLIYNNK